MEGNTPKNLGYRMPAEWEKHQATWLAWPKDPETFPKGIIEPVEAAYVKMIEALAAGEIVNVLVDDKEMEEKASNMINISKNVFFHHIRTADVWMRDYGPIFIRKSNQVAATKWIFNSWGNKYEELKKDNEAGMEIAKLIKNKIFEPGIVLEGGSIDTNGLGTCITTEQCLLNKNRNPHLNKGQIEGYLSNNLGFTNMIWLKEGIAGDDTDGHVDDIARFVNKNTIICMTEGSASDENYKALSENINLLEKSFDQDGKKLRVICMPMPRRVVVLGRRVPASYANFYIGNSAVILPIFNDKNDEKAISIIGKLFPDRTVVGVDCEALAYGYGGIHCVTQQQPSI